MKKLIYTYGDVSFYHIDGDDIESLREKYQFTGYEPEAFLMEIPENELLFICFNNSISEAFIENVRIPILYEKALLGFFKDLHIKNNSGESLIAESLKHLNTHFYPPLFTTDEHIYSVNHLPSIIAETITMPEDVRSVKCFTGLKTIPSGMIFNNNIELYLSSIEILPDKLAVHSLTISRSAIESIPNTLDITNLSCYGCHNLRKIAARTYNDLSLNDCGIKNLPDITVTSMLTLKECSISNLNSLTFTGSSVYFESMPKLTKLPNASNFDFLSIINTQITEIPDNVTITSLTIKGSNITKVGSNVERVVIAPQQIKSTNIAPSVKVLIQSSDVLNYKLLNLHGDVKVSGNDIDLQKPWLHIQLDLISNNKINIVKLNIDSANKS